MSIKNVNLEVEILTKSQNEEESSNVSEPFTLYLRSELNRTGLLRLPLHTARTLQGRWGVCLKQMCYRKSRQELIRSEPFSFLIYATQQNLNEYNKAIDILDRQNKLSNQTTLPISTFNTYTHACIANIFESDRKKRILSTPSGYYTIIDFLKNINGTLSMIFPSVSVSYANSNSRVQIKVGFVSGFEKKLHVFPLFGPQTRKLLGMPEPDSQEFKNMMNSFREDDIVMMSRDIASHEKSNLLVESSIIEHNGASVEHDCSQTKEDPTGHVMAVVSQADTHDLTHGQPVTYTSGNNNYQPLVLSMFDEIVLRVALEDTSQESEFPDIISAILCFKPLHQISAAPKMGGQVTKLSKARGERVQKTSQTGFRISNPRSSLDF